jgi:hypothetical protein
VIQNKHGISLSAVFEVLPVYLFYVTLSRVISQKFTWSYIGKILTRAGQCDHSYLPDVPQRNNKEHDSSEVPKISYNRCK